MPYSGLIITGTSGAGKSTLVERLETAGPGFVHVKAVTTRPPRPDDPAEAYEHLSREAFARLGHEDKLLVRTRYRGEDYGIRRQAVDDVQASGRHPLLTLTADSAADLVRSTASADGQYLSLFIDAPDEELDRRLATRSVKMPPEQSLIQRREDRSFREKSTYCIINHSIDDVVRLTQWLWRSAGAGGMLPAHIIKLMLRVGVLLENSHMDSVEGASYDLRLGDEYYYGGRIHRLSDADPILFVQPYDYAIVTSHEEANMPGDVSGRFDLAVNLFCQGIILSNGPQVDPGFRGTLFCLLFNTSSSPVLLKRRQHYATIEFHKLIEPTYQYRGKYHAKSLLDYLPPNAAQGAINELKRELESVRKESQTLQNVTWAILSLILAMIALWTSLK